MLSKASLLTTGLLLVGCSSPLPTSADGGPDGSAEAGADDGAADGTPADSSTDAAGDGEAGATAQYDDVTAVSNWESFDLDGWLGTSDSFFGGAFDGRYVYYIPSASTLVRYDTTLPFTAQSSWSKFDLTTIDSSLKSFFGAVVANGLLYIVPAGGVAVVYDTSKSFTDAASYGHFSLSSIGGGSGNAGACSGGTFDGRYVYFSADAQGFFPSRYDTTASFTSASSWQQYAFDPNTTSMAGTAGATFDGRYVYYAPAVTSNFLRYDTQQPFTQAVNGSWTEVTEASKFQFSGGTFDGRYVYFAPLSKTNAPQAFLPALRYDTQADFTQTTSWTSYLLGSNSQTNGWSGAVFDGRYVFFIPAIPTTTGPMLERYDTANGQFAAAGFESFNLVGVGAKTNSSYWGGAFDGEFVYLVPFQGPALRFKAKSPPSMPSSYHGSFF